MLFNIHTGEWDDELLQLFDIPRACLPRVLPCAFAPADEPLTADLGGAAVPITGIAGDQQAALFGQACLQPGHGQEHLWNGLLPAHEHGRRRHAARPQHLLATVAWRLGPGSVQYALEGSVFVGGAAVQWLRDGLGVIARFRRGRSAGAPRSGHRRGLLRARLHRPRRTLLGPAGTGRAGRTHARHDGGAYRARHPGSHRLPEHRCVECHAGGLRPRRA